MIVSSGGISLGSHNFDIAVSQMFLGADPSDVGGFQVPIKSLPKVVFFDWEERVPRGARGEVIIKRDW